MASPNEKDDFPMLPISDSSPSSRARPFTSNFRSISLSNTSNSANVVLGYTGPLGAHRQPPSVQMSGPLSSTPSPVPLFLPPPPTGGSSHSVGVSSTQPERCPSFTALEHKNSDDEFGLKDAHLLRSGHLEMCNDRYCTTCLSYYNGKTTQIPTSRVSAIFDSTSRNAMCDDAKGWATRSVNKNLTGIINPHYKFVQRWTRLFALWLVIFIDPLFLFLIKVKKNDKCIMIDWPVAKAFIAVRSVTDVLFFLNILLQFRLAYAAPESTVVVVGARQLFDLPRKIARPYLQGKCLLDLFIVLPLPQIWIFWILPAHLGASGGNYAKNFLTAAVLFQYIPKLCRLLPLLAGKTPAVFLFDSACSFVVNLLTFMLVGHVVGSCWYLFGLQRVNHCLRDACGNSHQECRELIYCGHENSHVALAAWKDNENASACFQEDGFPYGIYLKTVNLTNHSSLFTRYIYSLLYMGFPANQHACWKPSPKLLSWGGLFYYGDYRTGPFAFPTSYWNLEMSHKRFLEGIRGRVRVVEWVNWAATTGFNRKILFENMPNDFQRDIRRHLFIFLKKVRIFSTMDDTILDAIRERLTHRRYIISSTVLHRGGLVEKMVFIVRGEMESIGEDGSVLPLSEGDVCGEELLIWCLEHSSENPDGTRIRISSKGLVSNRSVRCLTDVEAFSLSVADLEDITSLFLRFLRSDREQGATKRLRSGAARQIQVPRRHRRRRRRLQRFYTAQTSLQPLDCNLRS
ncbi:unnamed protein product [Eruca vesicaria subsp. sativa]|uniref:Cyclic nucleotide-binding domain-containing protein n=1 Tax=Eruca vesicaria subsp. sativa TaxID=29727 RepID=A0ABC8LZA5_ERUVS|nr:unnamed protein product [Eruca vesicaria subsp. sativa]